VKRLTTSSKSMAPVLQSSISAARQRKCNNHRVLYVDCKRKRTVCKSNYLSDHIRHAHDTKPILRSLSRMRAELASELSLTIRRGLNL
jgi:uncharacterized protein YbcV (DUF1398 family)